MQELKFKLLCSRYWFIAIVVTVSFVGIFDHDLWTADEPRVAEIGREFLDEGASLAIPRLNGEPFMEKPPLYFWCVALSYKVFGGPSASAARIPSVLFGLGTLAYTFLLGRRMFGSNAAIWSCMILALSAEFLAISHKSLVDPSLVFFVTGAVYWLYSGLNSEDWKKNIHYMICYIFVTGAFFAKGFLGIAFPALLFMCWILWTRDWREINRARLWIGLPIVGTSISIWLWFLWKEGSWEYISTFMIHNNLQRFAPGNGDARGHVRPFYYYLINIWMSFAPWSILMPAVFFFTCRKEFQDKNRLFLVLWFFSGLLMLSLAGTKRTIYLVPLLPPIAMLTGSWFNEVESRVVNGKVIKISQWSILCACGICIIVLAGVAFKLELMNNLISLSLILLLAGGYVFIFNSFIKHKVIKLYGLPMLLSLVYVSLVLVFVPYINERKSFYSFCSKLGEIPAVKERNIYAFQPDETTTALVPFYTGNYIRCVNSFREARMLRNNNDDVLLIVLDKHKSQGSSKILRDIYPEVLISEHQGERRYLKLLSNKNGNKNRQKYFSTALDAGH
jgi:4-amino-4-deoxy-L-arabinose transferase and related glycosyltransferases of PMT family